MDDIQLVEKQVEPALAITSKKAQSITQDSALINFTVNQPGSGVVEYGESSLLVETSTKVNTAKTEHNISLSNLESNTTYYYRVRSETRPGMKQCLRSGVLRPYKLQRQSSLGISSGGISETSAKLVTRQILMLIARSSMASRGVTGSQGQFKYAKVLMSTHLVV